MKFFNMNTNKLLLITAVSSVLLAIILIPMIIANRLKAWWFAFICTVSSVAGGVAGYCIGAFFYSTIGIFIIKNYSLENQFSNFELSILNVSVNIFLYLSRFFIYQNF